MSVHHDQRPDPDDLLHALQRDEEISRKAKLKIFFGMCAGVGKTYDMLKMAHEALANGVDLVVGYVETHKRPETEALLRGLEIIPRKAIDYKGTTFEEMDTDAILARKPKLVLVDELAHTNTPGSRHTKRFMDIQELLDNGIDVWTTLNVQHLESRADTVAQITGAIVRETVPDSVLDLADDVELIDLPPDELLKRLSNGKVYTPERSKKAIENFFRKGNLTALREMSLRVTAERVDRQLRDYMKRKRISGPWKSGQRLIVGISGSPHSAQLLRWARRMAFSLDTSWVAVHVETSRRLSEAENARLAANIKLAGELGAEIVTTADEDVANALIRVARQENCTEILVGKSRSSRFLPSRDLLQQLLSKSGDLDVYVVGGHDAAEQPRSRFHFPEISSRGWQYAAAAAIVLAVVVACLPFREVVGYQVVALVLLLTVSLLPLMFGIGPVLLAAGLSALAWDFFYIPPVFTFSIGRPEDVLMLVMYFCIALVSGVLTTRARVQGRAVRQREERAVALYTLTRDLSEARSKDGVVRCAVTNIHRFFSADVVVCLGQADGDIFTAAHPESTLTIDEKEFAVAAWVYWNERKAGRFTDTLPSARATYFPLSGPRYPLGVIGVRTTSERALTLDQENLLENFIRQIASAVERETLNELTKQSIVVEESERLYKTLFNSISHEMRTPLAAIISASESIRDAVVSERSEIRSELAEQIHEAADRLNRLVENLLDMTRLESGLIRPKLDWCDLGDLITTTTRKLSKELARYTVMLDVPGEFPLIQIDFVLMEQALRNLLINASTYAPPGTEISISATTEGSECVLRIADNGPGIPEGSEERIFEKFYRIPGTQAGGTGLGLSIARGFVEAHKGTITAGRREGGGTVFTIRLPATPAPSREVTE